MSQGKKQASAADTAVVSEKHRPRRAVLFIGLCGLAAALALVYALAGAWRATQQREAYLPQLETQARRHPDDGPLLGLLGGRLMEAGEFPAAADTLKQAAAAGEREESLWLALAASNAASGQTGRAVADLRLGIANLPHAPLLPARLKQAQSLGPNASPGQLAQTISPEGAEPLLGVYARGSFLNGIVSWWGRRHPDSSGFATRQEWVQARPDDAEAQRFWGMALMQNRRLPEAVAVLHQSVALAPQSPASHLALADALRLGGHLPEAAQEYIAALRLHPNWLPAIMGLGAAFQASAIPTYALQAYTRATQVAPRSVDAWIALGTLEEQNEGLTAESVAAFQNAARLAPDRTDYCAEYAGALRLANRRDEAEVQVRRRLSQVPDDAYAHFLLGLLLMENKATPERLTEAESHLREALRLSPHNPVAEVQLSDLLLDRGQAPESAQLLSDSLLRSPYERRAILLLSRAYRLTGHPDLAEKAAQRAKVLLKDEDRSSVMEGDKHLHAMDIPFHQRLADLYDRTGLRDKAAQERLIIQRLQTAPQKSLQSSQELEKAVNAVLSPH